MEIHASAVVSSDAELAPDVVVGPNAVIEKGVTIGAGTRIGSNALICQGTRLGADNHVFHGAVIGTPPQDLKFKGEPSGVVLGDGNMIREYATIHRASGEGCNTVVGNNCYLMVNAHVAHNCVVGDRVVMTNASALGGYARVDEDAVLGGMSGVHQFTTVGRMVMVGGLTAVTRDVPPFMLVAGGVDARIRSLNSVGVMRKIEDEKSRENLKAAFKMLYRSGEPPLTALDQIESLLGRDSNVALLIEFLKRPTERGFCKFA